MYTNTYIIYTRLVNSFVPIRRDFIQQKRNETRGMSLRKKMLATDSILFRRILLLRCPRRTLDALMTR